MESEHGISFRDALSFAIGGGWGQEEPTGKEVERVRVIRGTDIPSVNMRQFREIPTRYETPSKVEKRRLRPGDIVLEISGGSSSKGQPTGRTVFIDEEVLHGLGGTAIPASFCRLVRVDSRRVLPKFAYYWLQEMYVSGRVFAYEKQSTGISNFQFEQFLDSERLAIPSMSSQEEIVAVLSPLESRQRLLRHTNATLESIAQALFRSWFVDFDPVRAKAEGREPEGMDAATAALFPAEFEDSVLGMIPKGWQVRRIEDLALKVAMGPFGSNIKVSTFVNSGVPVISGQHLRGTLLEDSEFNFITEEHAQKLSGSLVGADDIVLTHAGNIGQVALIPRDAAYRTYVLSQRQFYLRCNQDQASPEHLTYFLRSREGQHVLLANASQVGVPSIARPASYLKSIQVVAPPILIAKAFAEVARATHLSISLNRRRIALLEQVRGALLPRLISGKLRFPEVQAQLEEAIT